MRRFLLGVIMCVICTSLYAQKTGEDFSKFGPKTPENELVKLRYAMDEAVKSSEKKQILKTVEATGTFLGMMYAGKFLEDAKLGKQAAKTVVGIALAHPEYNGANTRQLLRKAQGKLGGTLRKKVQQYLEKNPAEVGFVSLFNGKDLTGWKGLVKNPIQRAKMSAEELAKEQVKADEIMRRDWKVENGLLAFVGTGYDNICTDAQYEDFEMYVDWMLDPQGKEPDAGIYLRGTPQVQIWDTSRVNVGAQVGSGGLYNNQKNLSKPTEVADNKTGVWNSFYIKMVGEKVTVFLNGVKVVDNIIMENYWDRNQKIFPVEQIELQAHGSKVYYRDIYVRRIEH